MASDSNPNNFRPRRSDVGGQQYLDATIRTASPARLRLMLTERAIEVAGTLSRLWRSGAATGSNEHSLKLLEIINELLSGIAGGETEPEKKLCLQVADLYVFLAQHLVAAESTSDADSIDEIRTVLEVEAETWRAVCAQEVSGTARPSAVSSAETPSSGGLNFSV